MRNINHILDLMSEKDQCFFESLSQAEKNAAISNMDFTCGIMTDGMIDDRDRAGALESEISAIRLKRAREQMTECPRCGVLVSGKANHAITLQNGQIYWTCE